jgi:heme/copper-type cytochrome/quinol oxidase subunit 1
MSTFEGPMMSIKSVNAVSHFTDWTIGHVHAGALGWNAFLSFAILYWAVPRLWKTELYSNKLATAHFWVSTIGLITYQVSMWVAGITQWAMWRAFEPDGRLTYPDFIETVVTLVPMYWVRALGGALYIAGMLMFAYNVYRTWKSRPATFEEVEANLAAVASQMGMSDVFRLRGVDIHRVLRCVPFGETATPVQEPGAERDALPLLDDPVPAVNWGGNPPIVKTPLGPMAKVGMRHGGNQVSPTEWPPEANM